MRVVSALVAAAGVLLVQPAAALVLDFESLAPGMIVDDSVLPAGVAITVVNNTPGHPDRAIVFDSSCSPTCSGEDFDLQTPGAGLDNGPPGQGNVLIIAEDLVDVASNDPGGPTGPDGRVDDPDDEAGGGSITFIFPGATLVESLTVLDVDVNEVGGFVELTLAAGGTATVPLAAKGNNSKQVLSLASHGPATALRVVFVGSGAIDDLVLSGLTTTTTMQQATTTTLVSPTTTMQQATTTTLASPTTTMSQPTTTTLASTTTTMSQPTTTTLVSPTTTMPATTTTSLPVATTTTLPATTCGDGVVEGAEECDDGSGNSNVVPDACREDCRLPFCGDGVVDSGEICEPPSSDTCDGDCRLAGCPLQEEICGNGLDDDGDGLIDCEDEVDCPDDELPPCGCEGLEGDPARIRFNTKRGGDYFSIHGNFRVHTPVDFANEPFFLILSNKHGVIWRGMLVPGELQRRKKGKGRHFFKDRNARGGGPGDADNFYRVGLLLREKHGERRCHFRVRVYGDFSRATEPEMTVQLAIGDDIGGSTRVWRKTGRGWILRVRDFSSQ